MFVHGIEMYLSEPVNCDDQLLAMLLKLWQFLHGIETLRKLASPTSGLAQGRKSPNEIGLAEKALPTPGGGLSEGRFRP